MKMASASMCWCCNKPHVLVVFPVWLQAGCVLWVARYHSQAGSPLLPAGDVHLGGSESSKPVLQLAAAGTQPSPGSSCELLLHSFPPVLCPGTGCRAAPVQQLHLSWDLQQAGWSSFPTLLAGRTPDLLCAPLPVHASPSNPSPSLLLRSTLCQRCPGLQALPSSRWFVHPGGTQMQGTAREMVPSTTQPRQVLDTRHWSMC